MHSDSGGVLVFSIGLNDYRFLYRGCIESQRAYARRFGFHYRVVDLPRPVAPADCSWMKIPLLRHALASGYDWVAFLDADVQVQADAPDFRTIAASGKDVYMALGASGRVNAGVIVVRRTDAALAWLEGIVADAEGPVAHEDRAPYENGHVIKHARGRAFVHHIDRRWNNSLEPGLADYFRHFTGPMKAQTPFGRRRRVLWRLRKTLRNLLSAWRSPPASADAGLRSRLGSLMPLVSPQVARPSP